MPYLSSDDATAVAAVLKVLDEQVQRLGPASEVRDVLDEWAQQLSTSPPGWVRSTSQLPSGG